MTGYTARQRPGGKYRRKIVSDPRILGGKPVIEGTRISVSLILELIASGWSIEDIVQEYPHLTPEDVREALKFASEASRKMSQAAGNKVPS